MNELITEEIDRKLVGLIEAVESKIIMNLYGVRYIMLDEAAEGQIRNNLRIIVNKVEHIKIQLTN